MNYYQMQFVMLLSSLLLLAILSGGLYAVGNTKTAISYLMQPGICLEINQDGNVSKVETQNPDALFVLGDLQLLNLSLENAIAVTVKHMHELGYNYGVDNIQ